MNAKPLAGRRVAAGAWPAAETAAELLAALGAEPTAAAAEAPVEPSSSGHPQGDQGQRVGLRLGEKVVAAAPSFAAEDWSASGVDELTGRPGGPPLAPVGAPATLARGLGLAIGALGGPAVDGAELLGMRVGSIPLARGGARSAGGAARLLATADGWVAFSLPRASDEELVPALIGAAVEGGDPWPALAAWAAGQRAADLVGRAALLGLAVAALGERVTAGASWDLRPVPADPPAREARDPTRTTAPLVVNLGALWAAPLCAQLLHRAGRRVVDVEATNRPDATPPGLRRPLREGHATIRSDLATDAGRDRLAALLAEADVVIEASRPRALRQLGLDAERVMADRRPRVWIRITGHGPGSERIAFGDDAAVAGGLVARDESGPVFAGDALADPLSGMTAAMLALACGRAGGAWLVDVPMAAVAARGAAG
ncbi:MAG: CoA transferase [Solirubrobacterales bacterium]